MYFISFPIIVLMLKSSPRLPFSSAIPSSRDSDSWWRDLAHDKSHACSSAFGVRFSSCWKVEPEKLTQEVDEEGDWGAVEEWSLWQLLPLEEPPPLLWQLLPALLRCREMGWKVFRLFPLCGTYFKQF